MSERTKIGLDNPAFQGRLRQSVTTAHSPVGSRPMRAHVRNRRPASVGNDMLLPVRRPVFSQPSATKPLAVAKPSVAPKPVAAPIADIAIPVVQPQPYAQIGRQPQRSKVLKRTPTSQPVQQVQAKPAVPVPQPVTPRPVVPTPTPIAQAMQVPQKVSRNPFKKYSRPQIALCGMAAIVFAVGVFASLVTLQTNRATKAQVSALSAQAAEGSTDAPPAEDKPTAAAVTGYSVAPSMPKFIKIPSLGVDARIRPMGVLANGQLKAPGNVYDAGWYDGSAKPGDEPGNGAMVIDGHVHGPSVPGVFYKLSKAKQGELVKIVRGDNKVFTYKVVGSQEFDVKDFDMAQAMTSIQPGAVGMNLITCSGPYDKKTGEYTKRTIVFTVLQS